MNKTAVIITVICLVSFCSCATLKDLFQEPSVTLEKVDFRDMSLFETTLVFNLKVANPNPVGAKIDEVSYRLNLDGNDFLKGVLDRGFSLKASGTRMIEIPLTVNYMNLFKTVQNFIKKDEVAYDLSGSFRINVFAIPYRAKGKLPVPKLPQIALKNVDIKKLSFSGASLLFNLDIKNKNLFAVNLKGLNYGIKLGGQELFSGDLGKGKTIPKNGRVTVGIPLKLDFKKFGTSVYNLFKKSSTDYELTGNMKFDVPKIGEKSFPYTKKGKVSIRK